MSNINFGFHKQKGHRQVAFLWLDWLGGRGNRRVGEIVKSIIDEL